MDSTDVFLIHSATINMFNVSDDGSEGIDIDYTVEQELIAMNISVEGNTQRLPHIWSLFLTFQCLKGWELV